MKETKEQIVRHLNRIPADRVKSMCSVACRFLMCNADFGFVSTAYHEDIRPIIEKMTGRRIPFTNESIISRADQKLFLDISRIPVYGRTRTMKKSEAIEVLSQILTNDTLFEGFCIATSEPDDVLAQICREFGCPLRYEELALDSVYRKRRAYAMQYKQYAKAVVNLYGSIHIAVFMTLVSILDPALTADTVGYTKAKGSYRNTLMFTPEWNCFFTVQHIIDGCLPGVGVSRDGVFVHKCFMNEIRREEEQLQAFARSKGRELNERDLSEFYDNSKRDVPRFRVLAKPDAVRGTYIPGSKEELLRYADPDYQEPIDAEHELRGFLLKRWRRCFEPYAQNNNISPDAAADIFILKLHRLFSDFGRTEELDQEEAYNKAFDLAESYGITFTDSDDRERFSEYVEDIEYSVRLWGNHGHTTEELMDSFLDPEPEDNHILTATNRAEAEFLDRNREAFERMGYRVDLDTDAETIRTFSMPQGLKGEVRVSSQKIYPNDPCPCGSGKKYKKCCGRK